MLEMMIHFENLKHPHKLPDHFVKERLASRRASQQVEAHSTFSEDFVNRQFGDNLGRLNVDLNQVIYKKKRRPTRG